MTINSANEKTCSIITVLNHHIKLTIGTANPMTSPPISGNSCSTSCRVASIHPVV